MLHDHTSNRSLAGWLLSVATLMQGHQRRVQSRGQLRPRVSASAPFDCSVPNCSFAVASLDMVRVLRFVALVNVMPLG